MRNNIAENAWDGNYYVRAYDDNGNVIGSHTNEQATLFLNSQSWAVLAKIPRAEQALEYAEKRLNRDLGIISVENAFSRFDGTVGHMSTKQPGVGENGGVYLHSSTFKLVADAILGKNELVEEGIKKILPFDYTYFKLDCEPYIFCNSYLAIENTYRYGTTGQSWGTGTAGWFYQALLKYVYGLKPEIKGLKVKPCLPPSWKKCALKYHFRGATYNFEFIQNKSEGMTVNGTTIDKNAFLPCEPNKEYNVIISIKGLNKEVHSS
jgi:cellobiose phosphorylase